MVHLQVELTAPWYIVRLSLCLLPYLRLQCPQVLRRWRGIAVHQAQLSHHVRLARHEELLEDGLRR